MKCDCCGDEKDCQELGDIVVCQDCIDYAFDCTIMEDKND